MLHGIMTYIDVLDAAMIAVVAGAVRHGRELNLKLVVVSDAVIDVEQRPLDERAVARVLNTGGDVDFPSLCAGGFGVVDNQQRSTGEESRAAIVESQEHRSHDGVQLHHDRQSDQHSGLRNGG
jgi:hypothetical protein